MRRNLLQSLFLSACVGVLLLHSACAKQGETDATPPASVVSQEPAEGNVHQFKVKSLEGQDVDLSVYKGKVLVIVNVASKCGYTPQYADLQTFYETYKDKGVVVLGFPANNFGNQEPGSNAEIQKFCSANYGVSFPMFEKISVKGPDMHPLYKYLTETTHEAVAWNFNKFLVDKNGNAVRHFKSGVKPDDKQFIEAVNAALNG